MPADPAAPLEPARDAGTTGAPRDPRTPRLGAAVFLIFFGLYLLLTGREVLRGDAVPLWEVAENLVSEGSVTVETQWKVGRGRDGKIYALLPLLDSLVHVPGAAARVIASRWAPDDSALELALATRLAPAILGALTCALFFALARRFVGLPAATVSTAAVGLATAVAVYARTPYTEIVQTCCFTGFVLAIFDALKEPTPRTARHVALWLGFAINAKLIYALSIPGVALVFMWRLRRDPRRMAILFAWAGVVLAASALPILWYNWVRFENPFSTGYGPTGQGTMWQGIWGLFFSPGKSIFLYNPPLILAAVGFPKLVRRNAPFALAILAAVVPLVLFYSHFMHWDGDWAWGPRYLTFAIPAFGVGLALVVDSTLQRVRLLRSAAVAVTLAAGLCVQVLGCTFYWDSWIGITVAATNDWLRKPVCPESSDLEEDCWPNGKKLYATHWLPALQPLAGHLWLLRHRPFNHPFAVAERDAPWQWHGNIHIPAAAIGYQDAQLDWWALDFHQHPEAARVIATIMFLPLAIGLLLWRRRVAAAGGFWVD